MGARHFNSRQALFRRVKIHSNESKMDPVLGRSHKQGRPDSLFQSGHLFDGVQRDAMRSRPTARSSSVSHDRQSERMSVVGRAQLKQSLHAPIESRMHDMSMSGFSLFLGFQLRLLQSYQLKLNIFRHGMLHVVGVQAQCVYVKLVRSNGFKHEFEFIGLDDLAEDAIQAILG